MECIQSPNVQYNQIVSKTLSLTIQRVTTNNTGTYACQVAGYDPRYFKTCDLQVKIGKFLFVTLKKKTKCVNLDVKTVNLLLFFSSS